MDCLILTRDDPLYNGDPPDPGRHAVAFDGPFVNSSDISEYTFLALHWYRKTRKKLKNRQFLNITTLFACVFTLQL